MVNEDHFGLTEPLPQINLKEVAITFLKRSNKFKKIPLFGGFFYAFKLKYFSG
jgi:hypothetical protein